jgi:Flp pilus assembly pilin Flp
MSSLRKFFAEDDGQDMVEYGLVISLVVIGGVTAYGLFGTAISGGINSITTSITTSL